jgi:hypothetical protein
MPTLARRGNQPGMPGIVAMPNRRIGAPFSSLVIARSVKPFRSQPFDSTHASRVTGVTRDSAGAALGSCVVQLFRTSDDLFLVQDFSDGSGNYTLYPTEAGPYYIVAYKPGGTDVAGTTVNTLGAV